MCECFRCFHVFFEKFFLEKKFVNISDLFLFFHVCPVFFFFIFCLCFSCYVRLFFRVYVLFFLRRSFVLMFTFMSKFYCFRVQVHVHVQVFVLFLFYVYVCEL